MSGDLSGAAADADASISDRPVGDTTEHCPNHWIEVQLVDEADRPVARQRFEIALPDGTTRTGQTDEEGVGRVEGIYPPGVCQISFTELDQEAWDTI